MPTHEVTNQPPPYGGFNVFATDPVLIEGVARWVPPAGQDDAVAELTRLGRLAGSDEAAGWADRAHANVPRLITHDRWGRRVDEVESTRVLSWLCRRSPMWRLGRVGWSSGSRWSCRRASWSSVLLPRWPKRSWHPGSAAQGARPSAALTRAGHSRRGGSDRAGGRTVMPPRPEQSGRGSLGSVSCE